jgi:hypothetical protein
MATCTPSITITDAVLTSSTAAEPGVGEQAYNHASTYGVGDRVILGSPASTVTITAASPGVVSWSAHGLPNSTPVVLTTTGALPSGLTAGVVYYIINRAAGTFQLSATIGGAPIVTGAGQSGTHTATAQVHRAYESLAGSNTGNPPAIDDGTKWLDIGPTNRWAMLDLTRSTQTWAPSPLTVVLTPGQRINSVFLGGLVADSVTIAMTVDAATVYSETISLATRNTLTWTDYFFKAIERRPSVLRQDLPLYNNAVVTVTITRADGLVGCGALVIGNFVYLGTAQMGAEARAKNFSRIDRTFDGGAILIPRRSVPTATMSIVFDKPRTRALANLRDELNAIPAVWSGLDDDTNGYFDAVLILGIHTTFDINLAHPDHGLLTATFEEV